MASGSDDREPGCSSGGGGGNGGDKRLWERWSAFELRIRREWDEGEQGKWQRAGGMGRMGNQSMHQMRGKASDEPMPIPDKWQDVSQVRPPGTHCQHVLVNEGDRRSDVQGLRGGGTYPQGLSSHARVHPVREERSPQAGLLAGGSLHDEPQEAAYSRQLQAAACLAETTSGS